MAASTITTPDGHTAGRVTIAATLVSLLPPLFAVAVLIGCFLVGIFDAETAATAILAVLATSGLTTGAVYAKAKATPTDQYATVERVVSVPAPDLEAKAAAAEATAHAVTPVIHDA